MKLLSILIISIIFLGCNNKSDITTKSTYIAKSVEFSKSAINVNKSEKLKSRIGTIVLSEVESKLLYDKIIDSAKHKDYPIICLKSNIDECPLLHKDRIKLLSDQQIKITVTDSWWDSTLKFERPRREKSGETLISVMWGNGYGNWRVTYHIIDRDGEKSIRTGLMECICRLVTEE